MFSSLLVISGGLRLNMKQILDTEGQPEPIDFRRNASFGVNFVDSVGDSYNYRNIYSEYFLVRKIVEVIINNYALLTKKPSPE